MNAAEVMKALEKKGTAQTKKTWMTHGCPEPVFGVKVGDMKALIKKTGMSTPLAKELYRTGNGDAMYFAGLIGNGAEMTRAEIQEWAESARWGMISEYTVPWIAAEHPEGWKIALEWIDSPVDKISAGGWNVLSSLAALRPDKDLDLKALERLMDRVVKSIDKAPSRTRYTMNGFVIAMGAFVKPLTKKALAAGAKIGTIEIDMGGTACKVPVAVDQIKHIIKMGRHGNKRKTFKC